MNARVTMGNPCLIAPECYVQRIHVLYANSHVLLGRTLFGIQPRGGRAVLAAGADTTSKGAAAATSKSASGSVRERYTALVRAYYVRPPARSSCQLHEGFAVFRSSPAWSFSGGVGGSSQDCQN